MNNRLGVVVTSFNQGTMIEEAVTSVLNQTRKPDAVVVVDDGSTDPVSVGVLAELEHSGVPIIRQENRGVSAARNTGIVSLGTELVAVLDGDDRFLPEFLAKTTPKFDDDGVVAASSWLAMFGVATGVVRPTGGRAVDFLARNACPAAAVVRFSEWERAGGYAEDMREGFEDWDFFLRILTPGGRIAIAPEALIEYRTQPGSANVRSMTRRLRLYSELIDRHTGVFGNNFKAALLAQEQTSMMRLARWEDLVGADASLDFGDASYGDGGMAAHVRIAANRSAQT
ncbi:glycosyltransferase family A protein [Arthrobacter tecti]